MIIPRTEQPKNFRRRFRITLTHCTYFTRHSNNYVQQHYFICYKPKKGQRTTFEHKIGYGINLTRSQAYVKAMNFIDNVKHTYNIADKDCLLCDINGVY